MSDLTASACGCQTGCNSSIIWIILLLSLFNGNGDCGSGCGGGLFGGNGNSCETIMIICLLLACCGNNC